MSFEADMPLVPWTVPPDWSGNGVTERLIWLTEILAPGTALNQKRRLRIAPRRAFDFEVLATGQERRLVDTLLFGRSAARFALPIWHDVQRLASAVSSGVDVIPAATDGYDFVAGGQAMLWRSPFVFELVDVETVVDGELQLANPTLASWGKGTRVYPIRAARIDEWGQDRRFNDRSSRRSVKFQIDEPCDWPELLPATTYRGYSVLEHRSEEGQDPTSSYERQLLVVDGETGPVSRYDLPEQSFRVFDHRWLISNRADHAALRSLFYGLAGRSGNLWVPTGEADLELVALGSLLDSTLTVQWSGNTLFGELAKGRRDIRIELRDGSALHRRIETSTEVGDYEELGLDSSLSGLDPAMVRRISFLVLCEQKSDAIELQHLTDADGLTRAATSFRSVAYDL